MDFFEAQAQAHKRTKKLIVLFVLAVAATIAAIYLVAVVILSQVNITSRYNRHQRHSYDYYYDQSSPAGAHTLALWDPQLFGLIAGGTILVIGGATLFKTAQLRSGGSAVAEMVGGRPIDPTTTDLKEKRLLNVVEEMAIASGIPVPAVYVLEEETGINAFAAGLTTSDAVVAVTRGSLEKFNRDELQGVVAHEFSHILNGDMRLNIRLVSVLFGIFFLTIIGRGLVRSIQFTGGNRGKRDGRLVIALLAIGVALIAVGSISYFFGRMIQAAVSRQREFLADASSVQFTRNPGGIVGALKKIGGYALGGRIQNARAAAISHFFFAESMRSSLTGLLATHPPLDQRILAIDPQFDGKFTEPRDIVENLDSEETSAKSVPAPVRSNAVSTAATLIASIGTLNSDQIDNARTLLQEIPAPLSQAAHSPTDAPVLIYGLLLQDEPAGRAHQLRLLPAPVQARLNELETALTIVTAGQKLPLCQLALPTLHSLEPAVLGEFFANIKSLIEADGCVSTFEFSLQKLLQRHVVIGRAPRTAPGMQLYSFQAVRDEIVTVLSAMSHASTDDPEAAQRAFGEGVRLLKILEGTLEPLSQADCTMVRLDAALDRLSQAAGPIKQRVLLACAQIASADGVLQVAEGELLRAISAMLDCPMPPLAL